MFSNFQLIETTWPDGSIHRTCFGSGGDVTHGGFTWQSNHPDAGVVIDLPQWSEVPGQFNNRDISFAVTDWLKAQLSAGNGTRFSIAIRNGERDLVTGLPSVQSVVWRGSSTSYSQNGDVSVSFVLAGIAAFSDLSQQNATFSPGYRRTLTANADTAFDLSGGIVAGVGTMYDVNAPFVPGENTWTQAANANSAVQSAFDRLGILG